MLTLKADVVCWSQLNSAERAQSQSIIAGSCFRVRIFYLFFFNVASVILETKQARLPLCQEECYG